MLKSHMDASENHLIHISKIPANSGHPLHKGTPREAFIKEFLESHLSSNVAVGTGEIIDASSQPNQARNQFDIVIYKRSYPKLDFGAGISGFLIESVIATIEVKSTLKKNEFGKAALAAFRSKHLVSNVVTSFHTGFIPPKILNFVVAYDGPSDMRTVHGWIQGEYQKNGINQTQLPQDDASRFQTAAAAIDGVFCLGTGFLFLDNWPYGFTNQHTRNSHPPFNWIVLNQADGNLLTLFLYLQAATSNLEGSWLNPGPYVANSGQKNVYLKA